MRGCARDIRGPSCANMQVEEWAFRFDLSPATTLWPIRPGIHEGLRDGSMPMSRSRSLLNRWMQEAMRRSRTYLCKRALKDAD